MKNFPVIAGAFLLAVLGFPAGRMMSSLSHGKAKSQTSIGITEARHNGGIPPTASLDAASFPDGRATIEDIRSALLCDGIAEQSTRIDGALRAMSAAELGKLFANYNNLDSSAQVTVLPMAIGYWLKCDPDAATEWMASASETFRSPSTTFSRTMDRFARADIGMTEKLLEKMKPGERKNELQRLFFLYRFDSAPNEAFAALNALPEESPQRIHGTKGILAALATRRPAEIFGKFASEQLAKHPLWRPEILALMAPALAQQGYVETESALGQLTNPAERVKLLNAVAPRMRDSDKARLGDYLFRQIMITPELANQFSWMNEVIGAMAKQDGQGAILACDMLPSSSRLAEKMFAAFHWAVHEPDKAMVWAQAQANESERNQFVENTFRGWASVNPLSAHAWLEKLPESRRRTDMAAALAQNLIGVGNYDLAFEWIGRMPPSEQRLLAGNIVASISTKDPVKAARWLSEIEPDKDTMHLFGTVTDSWVLSDYKRAAAWVSSLPAGDPRDTAAGRFATTVAGTDPRAAGEWAMTVANKALRSQVVADVYCRWRRVDPRSAADWLGKSGISETQIRNLLR